MSRLLKIVLWGTMAVLTVACSEESSRINLTVKDAAFSDVVVKRLDPGAVTVLDTVALDASGRLSYELEVEEGDPDIIYFFYSDKKIASVIVKDKDVLSVEADTLGNFSVKGSEESEKLALVEKEYTDAVRKMSEITSRLGDVKDEGQMKELNAELTSEYVRYCRSRIRYIMENSTSLSSVPVVYQKLGELPVFGQITDAIHINNLAQSLSAVYPDSRYVRSLSADAARRLEQLDLQQKLELAQEIGFPEITLPDISGVERRLSETGKRAVLLHFWTSEDAAQKMFNLETLLPLYKEFSGKGFEIYQVALDADKSNWARVVKAQELPWINVCDSRGAYSEYVRTYNLKEVPSSYLIFDGTLVDEEFAGGASLRKLLKKLL